MARLYIALKNTFLKQPRRGKTREAQLTPHKALAAVWGLYKIL